MQKMSKLKRFFVILFSMVIAISPTFFAGCEVFDTSYKSKNPLDFETHYGGGGAGGYVPDEDEEDSDSSDSENELSDEEYYEYFKNYRLTYKPGEVERENFNESIKEQNETVSEFVLKELFNKYGNSSEALFDNNQLSLSVNEKNIVYVKVDETGEEYLYFRIKFIEDYTPYYSHKNAINGDNSKDISQEKWEFNTYLSTDSLETAKQVEEEDFVQNDTFLKKLQLAQALILSGNYIDSEDETKNTFKSIYDPLKDESADRIDSVIDEYVNEVNHLGWTDGEIKQLSSYILNYVIGESVVQKDNERFFNAYSTNGEDLVVLNDDRYDRFLTNETYLTLTDKVAKSYDIDIDERVEDDEYDSYKNAVEGLLYYAKQYLMSVSKNNFDASKILLNGYLNVGRDLDASTVEAVQTPEFTQTIFNQLIATKTEIKDEDDQVIATNYNFDANVWGYDKTGEIQDKEYLEDDERASVLYTVGNKQYSLFSVRLPYFKNYFNTVHFMVKDILTQKVTEENKAELDAEWRESHPNMDEYPYQDVFPTIPFTYFTDFDATAMVFDDDSGEIDMKDSGYQQYQSFMIMPSQDIILEDAFFLFKAPPETTQSFQITVYIRYFDGETQSYATWESAGEESEFYKAGVVDLEFNQQLDGDEIVDDDEDDDDDGEEAREDGERKEKGEYTIFDDFGLKSVLRKAKINGEEKGNCLLKAFDEETEVLCDEPAQLVTKDNYGYWFNYQTTPEGQDVVCFDGKNAHSSSYLEFVFYNPTNTDFVFMFYPEGCYKA